MSRENPGASDGGIGTCHQAEVLGKVINSSKENKKKPKTEPANQFGQFMKHKRAIEGEFKFEQARLEWKDMSEEDKGFYKKCYVDEKAALGDNYREGRKRKSNKKNEIKENQYGGKKGPKVQEDERTESSLELLAKVEYLDSEMERVNLEGRGLQEQLCNEKVKLAVNQFKLDEKTNECNNLKEKYKTLVTQHSNC